jgi:rhodanese-related sulfurtransferase
MLWLGVISVGVGTLCHQFRPDGKNRIRLIEAEKYPLALTVKKAASSPLPGPSTPTVQADLKTGGGDQAASGKAAPPGSAPAGAPAAEAPPPASEVPSSGFSSVEEISAATAYAEYQAGGVIFLDARRSSQYEEAHVAGARSLSLWEADFEDRLDAFLNLEDPGAPIIIYCRGQKCEDSHQVALRLLQANFTNVRIIKEGFPGWQDAGYPVESGAAAE